MSTVSRRTWILGGGLLLAVVIAAGLFFFLREDAYEFKGGSYEPPNPAPALDLTDQRGDPFTLADQDGKIVLVYFGYTYCPDFCPTTMAELQRVKEILGDGADDVEMVMVTVDPERDTPERLGEYMDFFNPDFYGLSGSEEQTVQVMRDWGIVAQKHEPDSRGLYLVDHTTSLFAVDQEGNLILTWAYGTPPEDIAADIQHLLSS